MKRSFARAGLSVSSSSGRDPRPTLITGGAGFIGTNVAHRLLSAGRPVVVFDNLSRPGVERNLRWLRDTHGRLLRIELGDVRDRSAVQRAVSAAGQVIHLASQVAVTTSLLDPLHDFDVNARGTLNVLSALNTLTEPPPLLFTSTNKVYGCLGDVALERHERRYVPSAARIREHGVDETRPLDFHSPYGCSKGAADQYVLDYARTFDMRATVFRMSCIYGPHQFGTEDQGWVAHFLIRALRGEPVTLFGDGRQVRDLLFVDDLVDAMELAFDCMDECSGRAFNMGGGAANTTSLLELIDMIAQLVRTQPEIRYEDWRLGDQRYYVSSTASFTAVTGWQPRTGIAQGLSALHTWLASSGAAEADADTTAAAPIRGAAGKAGTAGVSSGAVLPRSAPQVRSGGPNMPRAAAVGD